MFGTVKHGLLALVVLTVAAATLASVAPPSAEAHRQNCYYGVTFEVGDPKRVFPMPHGCVWLYRSSTMKGAQEPPEIRTRVHGVNRSHQLPRTNFSEGTAGLCGEPVVWWFRHPFANVVAREDFGASGGWPFGSGCASFTQALLWTARLDGSGRVADVWTHRGARASDFAS